MQILKHIDCAGEREEEILAIIRDTRLQGPLTYHYERIGGYANYARLQGKSFEVFEARDSAGPLGFTQITLDQVRWNRKACEVAYS